MITMPSLTNNMEENFSGEVRMLDPSMIVTHDLIPFLKNSENVMKNSHFKVKLWGIFFGIYFKVPFV